MKLHLFTHSYGNYVTIMLKFNMDQFYVLRNHGAKFCENRITLAPSSHIKPPLEIHVYSYEGLK